MQSCRSCGLIRPDSQATCDCVKPERRFDAGTKSTCGIVSLATAIGIELAIIGVQTPLAGAGFGAIGVFLLNVLLAGIGVVVNTISGLIAYQRGETGAARIAAVSAVALVATVFVVRGR